MKTMKEEISCLVDNEAVDNDAVLAALKSDPGHVHVWRRYHLIGEILRGNKSAFMTRDISEKVMSRLATEPTLLSPSSLSARSSTFLKPAVGFAIAATVAAVTVVSLQYYRQVDLPNSYEVVAIAKPQPFVATPVSFGDKQLNQSGKPQWDAANNEAQEQLSDYLMVHAEYASTGNIQGMLPYVRLAGFDKNQ